MTGLADSPFFAPPLSKPTPAAQRPVEKLSPNKVIQKTKAPISKDDQIQGNERTSNHDTMTPRNRDTTVSSNHDTMTPNNQDVMLETVRKAVKELGKEAATHRFTVEEKRGVLDLIYTYKGSGVKTSENEVARIAINYILEDYKQNGRNSILDKVLKALNE